VKVKAHREHPARVTFGRIEDPESPAPLSLKTGIDDDRRRQLDRRDPLYKLAPLYAWEWWVNPPLTALRRPQEEVLLVELRARDKLMELDDAEDAAARAKSDRT
jgi:hypothetical protein